MERVQAPPGVDVAFTSLHVGIAAEGFAAAMFARCGLDVTVQYGPSQPDYDLIVSRGEHFLKIAVKGSKDGGWIIIPIRMESGQPDYLAAIDRWLARHTSRTVLCLVQFQGVPIDEMPRIYIAGAADVAAHLRSTARGLGDTTLYERKVWSARAPVAGSDEIPPTWRFSRERVEMLLLGSAPAPAKGNIALDL